HLILRKDGTYTFSGRFNDSGLLEYNLKLVWAVKDVRNQVYTFEQPGHVSGTFEPGSRDYDWNLDAQNDAISQNWQYLAIDAKATVVASANLDFVNLGNSAIGALGLVLAVIGIVVGGKPDSPPRPQPET